MHVSPIVLEDILVLILSMPTKDKSLQMELCEFTAYMIFILCS